LIDIKRGIIACNIWGCVRVEQDKNPGFLVILMIGSDLGRIAVADRDYRRLQQIIQQRAITLHIIVIAGVSCTTGGALQTDVGLALTKLGGGRYEIPSPP
jgi:hypothetical protein